MSDSGEDDDSDNHVFNIEITRGSNNQQRGNTFEELSEESFSVYFDDGEEDEDEEAPKKVDLSKIKEIKLKRKKKQACSVCLCDMEKGD